MQFVFNQSMLFYTWDINKQANTHTERERKRESLYWFFVSILPRNHSNIKWNRHVILYCYKDKTDGLPVFISEGHAITR